MKDAIHADERLLSGGRRRLIAGKGRRNWVFDISRRNLFRSRATESAGQLPRANSEENQCAQIEVECLAIGIQSGDSGINDSEEQKLEGQKIREWGWRKFGEQPGEKDQHRQKD